MITIILLLLFLAWLGFVLGSDVVSLIAPKADISPVSLTWIGLGIWSCLLWLLALFMGIPWEVYLGAAVYVLMRWFVRRDGWRGGGLPVLAAALSAFYVWRPIEFFDTLLYHVSAVMWYGTNGIVPGLGLLSKRLGFTSSWFALDASLNHGLLAERVYILPGLLVLMLLLWQALYCLGRLWRQQGGASDGMYAAAFVVVWAVCWKMRIFSSCSPDLPVIGLMLQIIYETARRLFREVPQTNPLADVSLLLVACVIGFCFKVSFMAFLMVAGVTYVIVVLRHRAGWSWRLVLAPLVGALLLAISITTFIVTTGFLLFPSTALRLNLPWSLTVQDAAYVQEETLQGDRWGPDWEHMPRTGFWFWHWIHLAPIDCMLAFAAMVAIVRLAMDRRTEARWLAVLGTVATVIFWSHAPTLRFALGFFAGLTFVALGVELQSRRWLAESLPHLSARGRFILAAGTGALCVLVAVSGLYLSPAERLNRKLTREFQPSAASEWVRPMALITLAGPDLQHLSRTEYDERTTPSGVTYYVVKRYSRSPGNYNLMATFWISADDIAYRDARRGPAGGFMHSPQGPSH